MKKTKYGDYETYCRFPVFSNFTVYIVFTGDIQKSYTARYGTRNPPDTDNTEALLAHGGKCVHAFFQIGTCPSGTVAHEAYRAIRYMFDDFAGVRQMDNEIVAYHLGYLVQKINNFKFLLIDAGVDK